MMPGAFVFGSKARQSSADGPDMALGRCPQYGGHTVS